jgi:hypothetical protein
LLVIQRRAIEIEVAAQRGRTPPPPKQPTKISTWAGPLFVAVWLALLVCGAAIRA